ncbi:MAG: lipopolysaccharide biosynthesis protein [Bacteroidota bacterium]
MSLKKKSLTGFAWDLSGKLGLQGVGFFISIILARLLAPEDFGLLAIILVFTNLAGVFLDFGFSTALIQRKEVNEKHYSSVFILNIVAGVFLTALIFLLAPIIAKFYDKPIMVNLIRVSALSFIINSFGNVTRAHLRRSMNFKAISYSNIIGALISGVVAVTMALTGYGVWSLVIQILIGQFLANIILYFFSPLRFSLKFNIQSIKELWGFSSKVFFSGIVDSLFINLDSLLIGKFISPTILGFYYRAKSLENFTFRYTAGSLASVLLPGLSSIQDDNLKLKEVTIKAFHMLSFVSFFLSGLLLVSGREIIILLFSAKWEPSVVLFQILIAGAFSSQIFSLFYNVLLSRGQSKVYLKINVLSKTFMLLNLGILFYFNLQIYLTSFIVIKFFTLLLGLYYVSILLDLKYILFKNLIKYLILFAFISAVVLLVKNILPIENLLITLLTTLLLYGLLTFLISSMFKLKGTILIVKELKSFHIK